MFRDTGSDTGSLVCSSYEPFLVDSVSHFLMVSSVFYDSHNLSVFIQVTQALEKEPDGDLQFIWTLSAQYMTGDI